MTNEEAKIIEAAPRREGHVLATEWKWKLA